MTFWIKSHRRIWLHCGIFQLTLSPRESLLLPFPLSNCIKLLPLWLNDCISPKGILVPLTEHWCCSTGSWLQLCLLSWRKWLGSIVYVTELSIYLFEMSVAYRWLHNKVLLTLAMHALSRIQNIIEGKIYFIQCEYNPSLAFGSFFHRNTVHFQKRISCFQSGVFLYIF